MNALMAAFFLAAPAHAQLLELPDSVGIDPVEVEAILRVELSGRALDGFRFAAAPAPDGALLLSASSSRSESRTMSLAGVEPHARARLLALMLVELARLASAPIDETVSAIPPPPPAGASAPADPARPAETSETLEAPSPSPRARHALDDEIPGRLDAPSLDEGDTPIRLDLELGLRAFFRDLTAAPSLAAGIDIANAVAVGARVLGFVYSNDLGAVALVQATAWTSVRLFAVDFGARFGLLLRGELGYAHAFGRSDTPGIVASDYGAFTAGSSIAPELTWNVDSVELRFVVEVGFQYGIAPTALGQIAASFHGFYLGPALGLRFDL